MPFNRIPLIATALMTLSMGSAAIAHPKLVASNPTANATVVKPKMIELRFSEKLVGQFSSVDLVMIGMPGMKAHAPMKIGGLATSIRRDGKTMIVKLKAPLSAGTYKLDWHAVSADTHRVNGTYSFRVK